MGSDGHDQRQCGARSVHDQPTTLTSIGRKCLSMNGPTKNHTKMIVDFELGMILNLVFGSTKKRDDLSDKSDPHLAWQKRNRNGTEMHVAQFELLLGTVPYALSPFKFGGGLVQLTKS